MNEEHEMSSHENYLRKCIKEKLEEIEKENQTIQNTQQQLDKTILEYNKQQLSLEQEQITIKHQHEEQGIKPTQAKEKAKLETQPEQRKQISYEAHVTELKREVEVLKRKQKLSYVELDFLMIQYQEIVGGCKCSG